MPCSSTSHTRGSPGPGRDRRITLMTDYRPDNRVGRRGGVCPFEILFEPQSGQGDPAPSHTATPAAAATPTAGAGAARRSRPPRRRRDDPHVAVAATLTASYGDGPPAVTAPTPSSCTRPPTRPTQRHLTAATPTHQPVASR